MYCCSTCASAYLDPRPTEESIGLAYQCYFTHDDEPSFSSLSFLNRLRRRLANGYRNYRYGTRDYPASVAGVVTAALMRNGRATIDAGMRHLPSTSANKRLLDLGCGNGSFLLRARSAGWDVIGVDFDDHAVRSARSHGLDVRHGGVESLDPSVDQFDVVTLAHVIEHVHRPVEVLQACYKLLKPGGFLWIDTPNIASDGHRIFGIHWRGLEIPRHLVLFNIESMRSALTTAGFAKVKVQPYRPLCKTIFHASAAIAGEDEQRMMPNTKSLSGLVRQTERRARRDPLRREFINLKAWKE
jgi:2-polyprenyl-3-methyl-5-hydroxy-6-metoxy-1,4-benzoquinol methylase